MGEVARLGMEIDAKGVAETRAELLQLAKSAAEAARQFEATGGSIEQSGRRMGNAPDGFLPFVAGAEKAHTSTRALHSVLFIATEQLGLMGHEAQIATGLLHNFGAVGTALAIGVTVLAAAYHAASAGTQAWSSELTDLRNNLKSLDVNAFDAKLQSIKDVTESRGGLFGNVVEGYQRIKALFTGNTIEIFGKGGLSGLQSLEEENRFVVMKNKVAQVSTEIRDQIDLLGKTEPEAIIFAGQTVERELTAKFKAAGASVGDAAKRAGDLAHSLTVAKLDENFRQALVQAQQTSDAIIFEAAAIGRTGEAIIRLNTVQKINQIATSELARAHSDLAAQLIQEQQALGAVQVANQRLTSGQQAISQFQQNFGVQFDFDKQNSGRQLAQNFAAVFNQLKNDPAAAAQLNQAFASLAQQAVALGLPDIPGLLLSSGLSGKDVAGLMDSLRGLQLGFQQVDDTVSTLGQTAGGATTTIEQSVTRIVPIFGTDLANAVEASRQNFFRWGIDFDSAATKNVSRLTQIGAEMDVFNQRVETAAQSTAQAVSAVLDAIPDVTHKTLIIDTYYAASPAKPFSQFLPFMQSQFLNLSNTINATPDYLLRISGLPQAQREVAQLAFAMDQIQRTPVHTPGTPFYVDQYGIGASGNVFLSQAEKNARLANVSAQLADARAALPVPSAQAQSYSGGGGNGNITIDLRGAVITPDTLDSILLPKFEEVFTRVTGKNPDIRVLS